MSAIQARIQAFETLKTDPKPIPGRKPPVKLYESPAESLLDSNSPPAALSSIRPIIPSSSSSSDLSRSSATFGSFVNVSPEQPMPPQLPPRKGSDNITNGTTTLHPYTPRNGRGHAHATSTSSFHSVSLSDNGDAGLDGEFENLPSPEMSTFSLIDKSRDSSVVPAVPPSLPPRPTSTNPAPALQISYAVRKGTLPPPVRTNKPIHKPSPLELSSVPKPRSGLSSSRASLMSINSATSSASSLPLKRKRPPLPPPARARYDAVFEGNLKAQREASQARLNPKIASLKASSRRAMGWRGTSMDITNDSTGDLEEALAAAVNTEEKHADSLRLYAETVKRIWLCSKLPKETLRSIWNECDVHQKGSLDKEEFANGMWRIDNELLYVSSAKSAFQKRSSTRSSIQQW